MHLQWIAWITPTFGEKNKCWGNICFSNKNLRNPFKGNTQRGPGQCSPPSNCAKPGIHSTHITKLSEESPKSSWSKKSCVKCGSCSRQTWLWVYNPSSIPPNQAPAVSHARHPLWTLAMLFITALQTCAVSCIPASPLPLGIASHIIN